MVNVKDLTVIYPKGFILWFLYSIKKRLLLNLERGLLSPRSREVYNSGRERFVFGLFGFIVLLTLSAADPSHRPAGWHFFWSQMTKKKTL